MDLGDWLQSNSKSTHALYGVTLIFSVATDAPITVLVLLVLVLVLVSVLLLLLLVEFLLSLLLVKDLDFIVLVSFSGLRLRLLFVYILCTLSETHLFPVYEAMRMAKFGTESINL